jgi:hypothetical protein
MYCLQFSASASWRLAARRPAFYLDRPRLRFPSTPCSSSSNVTSHSTLHLQSLALTYSLVVNTLSHTLRPARPAHLRLRFVWQPTRDSVNHRLHHIYSDYPNTSITMSHEEDLIDYSDEEIQPEAPTNANGAAAKGGLAAPDASGEKKGSYVGIHSTGFRDFLLKDELVRAITDCGFEHPSEG